MRRRRVSSWGKRLLSVRPARSYKLRLTACQPVDPLLQPLLAPLTSLRGVGPALADKIARVAGGGRVLDLLFHMPDGYLDRSNMPKLAQAETGTVATLQVEVVGIEEAAPPRPWKVVPRSRWGLGGVPYFAPRPPPIFQKGAKLAISGKI